MTPKRRLFFIHEGKAAYPEIGAYRRFFGPFAETAEISPAALRALDARDDDIFWFVMGFYPRAPHKGIVVHDYRSLSVPPCAGLKDFIKRHANARPALRIFQNDALRQKMDFYDGVPSLLLPMGVPTSVLAFRTLRAPYAVDFAYAGALSFERESDRMIDHFLDRYGETKSLALYGEAPEALRARYAGIETVLFKGYVPQEELFPALRAARVAVAAFPNHFPHLLQTPTKLLEYAALGLRILANEHPASRRAAEDFGIKCFWGPADDPFFAAPDLLEWEDNGELDPTPLLWPSLIAASGVGYALGLGGEKEGER